MTLESDPQTAIERVFATTPRVELAFCQLTLLCEISAVVLSLHDDICNACSSGVNSTSHKGKPVGRQGRKASGPNGAHERSHARSTSDSGAAGEASRSKLTSSLLNASAFVPCRRRLQCIAHDALASRAGRRDDELGAAQLNRANPSKGGDAKPPVYGTQVLRQRGCQSARAHARSGTHVQCEPHTSTVLALHITSLRARRSDRWVARSRSMDSHGCKQ